MYGHFNEEAQEAWDFARCQRADGTFYGTRGKCKKGKAAGAKEEEPKQPRSRKKKAEEKKPVIEAPKEEKGYTPKEKPEARKGLRGLKDRLLGGKKKDLDDLVPGEAEIRQSADTYALMLRERAVKAKTKKDRKILEEKADSAEKNAELEISRLKANKKFTEDLKANLSANVKAEVDKFKGGLILTQKVGKNTIKTTFNQEDGFNYQVNGKYDAGSVKDRKEQLRIALAVRGQYDALVRSLPEGTVIKTSPWDGDGGGSARQKAYEKIGFGKPNNMDEMFAMKKGGKMVPATSEQQDAAYGNPDTVWFAEEGDSKEEIKAWFQIVTGVDVGV